MHCYVSSRTFWACAKSWDLRLDRTSRLRMPSSARLFVMHVCIALIKLCVASSKANPSIIAPMDNIDMDAALHDPTCSKVVAVVAALLPPNLTLFLSFLGGMISGAPACMLESEWFGLLGGFLDDMLVMGALGDIGRDLVRFNCRNVESLPAIRLKPFCLA